MTTIMPNAFMLGIVTKNLRSSLNDIDNCLTGIDAVDYAKLDRARTKLLNALDAIDKLIKSQGRNQL